MFHENKMMFSKILSLLKEHRYDFIHVTTSANHFDKNDLCHSELQKLIYKVPEDFRLEFTNLLVIALPFLSSQQLQLLQEHPNSIKPLREIYAKSVNQKRKLDRYYTLSYTELILALKRDSNQEQSKEYEGLLHFIRCKRSNGYFDENAIFTIATLLITVGRLEALEIVLGKKRYLAILQLYRNRDYHRTVTDHRENRRSLSRYNQDNFLAILSVPHEHALSLSKLLIIYPDVFTEAEIDFLCSHPQHVSYLLSKTIDYCFDEPTLKNLASHINTPQLILSASNNLENIYIYARTLHWLNLHSIATADNKIVMNYKLKQCNAFLKLPMPKSSGESRELQQIIFNQVINHEISKENKTSENFSSFFVKQLKTTLKINYRKKIYFYELDKNVIQKIYQLHTSELTHDLTRKSLYLNPIRITLQQLMELCYRLNHLKAFHLLEDLVGKDRAPAIECICNQEFSEILFQKVLEIEEDYAWDFVSLVMRFRKFISDEQINLAFTMPELIRPLYQIFNTLFQVTDDVKINAITFPFATPSTYLQEINTQELITLSHTHIEHANVFAQAIKWLRENKIATTKNILRVHALQNYASMLEQIDVKDLLKEKENVTLIQNIFDETCEHIINNLQHNRVNVMRI